MKISYSQIEEQCNELHLVAKNIKESLDNIEQIRIKVSNDDNWVGNAASVYLNKLEYVTKNFDNIYKEIEFAILYLASCAEGYQAIDKNVIEEITSSLNLK